MALPPLVLGSEPVRIEPRAKKSAQMEKRGPKPQPLLQNGSKELDPDTAVHPG